MTAIEELIFLAQRSNSDDFMKQMFGLIVMVCGLTVVWMTLMYLIYRRSNERRKAAKEGRPIPPPLYVSAYQAIQGWLNPETAPRAPASSAPPARPGGVEDSSLLPDLDLLMGDLPMPDLDTLLDEVDAAAAPPPAPAPTTTRAGAFAAAQSRSEYAAPIPDSASGLEAPGIEMESTAHTDEGTFAMTLPPISDDAGTPPDAIELLRVYRDLSDGSLIVQIGDRHFRALTDLRGTDLERRFLNVLRDLNQMARAMFSSAARNAQAGNAPAAPAPAPAPAPAAPVEPVRPVEPPALDDLSLSPGTMFRQMTRVAMGHKPEVVEHAPQRSVAEQIEAVLQNRLKGLPDFRRRSIHVWQAPSGGVRIEVDGQFFEGVGEVADPAVRDLILDVVREWESSGGG